MLTAPKFARIAEKSAYKLGKNAQTGTRGANDLVCGTAKTKGERVLNKSAANGTILQDPPHSQLQQSLCGQVWLLAQVRQEKVRYPARKMGIYL